MAAPSPFKITDDYGTTRDLVEGNDGAFHGTLVIDGEVMPYTLPRAVVEKWAEREFSDVVRLAKAFSQHPCAEAIS